MAGLLRHTATKLFVPPSHLHLGRRSPASFVAVRCMASSKLFVGGLSFHTDETTLRNAFAAHAEVVEVKIIVDRNTGMSRGFAFVTFNSESDADVALKAMDGQIVNGRVVRVDYATNKPREGTGGGFQRRSSDGYSFGGSGFPFDSSRIPGDPSSTGSAEDKSKLGWSESSPSAEDFGPIYPRIVFGPKTLQGGYEYSPGPQVPLNVGPAFASSNPGFQKSNPVNPNNDIDSTFPKSSYGFSGCPADTKSSSGLTDDLGPAYPKSSSGLSDDIGPAYPKSSPGLSSGAKSTFDLLNDIDPTYPRSKPSVASGTTYSKTSSGFPSGSTNSKSRFDFLDGTDPAYPSSKPSFSAGPAYPKPNTGVSDNIGSTYPRSSSGFSSSFTDTKSSPSFSDSVSSSYPKGSPGFSGGFSDSKSSSGFSGNFGPAYQRSNTVVSGGPANVKSSPGLAKDIGPAYPDGGNSYSFTSSEEVRSKAGSSENPDPISSDVGSGIGDSGNSDVGPKCAQSGF